MLSVFAKKSKAQGLTRKKERKEGRKEEIKRVCDFQEEKKKGLTIVQN